MGISQADRSFVTVAKAILLCESRSGLRLGKGISGLSGLNHNRQNRKTQAGRQRRMFQSLQFEEFILPVSIS